MQGIDFDQVKFLVSLLLTIVGSCATVYKTLLAKLDKKVDLRDFEFEIAKKVDKEVYTAESRTVLEAIKHMKEIRQTDNENINNKLNSLDTKMDIIIRNITASLSKNSKE